MELSKKFLICSPDNLILFFLLILLNFLLVDFISQFQDLYADFNFVSFSSLVKDIQKSASLFLLPKDFQSTVNKSLFFLYLKNLSGSFSKKVEISS